MEKEYIEDSHEDYPPTYVEQEQENKMPAYVEELLSKGTTVLKAKTREELAEMLDQIPADCKYAAGAVGQSYEDGSFTLRIDKLWVH